MVIKIKYGILFLWLLRASQSLSEGVDQKRERTIVTYTSFQKQRNTKSPEHRQSWVSPRGTAAFHAVTQEIKI